MSRRVPSLTDFIEHYRSRLNGLELERLKLVRDQRAFLFLIGLALFLGVLCAVSGFFGSSKLLEALGLLLILTGEFIRRLRIGLDERYQSVFRGEITRDWFRAQTRDAYLSSAPTANQIPLEILNNLREACLRATDQAPSRTTIEERVFFDSDSPASWIFILQERSRWSSAIRSRAVVWFRATFDDSARVAFVWPSLAGPLARVPEFRFFEGGKPVAAPEGLKTKLLNLYDFIRQRSVGQTVRIALSPTGLWAGVKLKAQPFVGPVSESCLKPEAYQPWLEDLRLLSDRDIPQALANF